MQFENRNAMDIKKKVKWLRDAAHEHMEDLAKCTGESGIFTLSIN